MVSCDMQANKSWSRNSLHNRPRASVRFGVCLMCSRTAERTHGVLMHGKHSAAVTCGHGRCMACWQLCLSKATESLGGRLSRNVSDNMQACASIVYVESLSHCIPRAQKCRPDLSHKVGQKWRCIWPRMTDDLPQSFSWSWLLYQCMRISSCTHAGCAACDAECAEFFGAGGCLQPGASRRRLWAQCFAAWDTIGCAWLPAVSPDEAAPHNLKQAI